MYRKPFGSGPSRADGVDFSRPEGTREATGFGPLPRPGGIALAVPALAHARPDDPYDVIESSSSSPASSAAGSSSSSALGVASTLSASRLMRSQTLSRRAALSDPSSSASLLSIDASAVATLVTSSVDVTSPR